MLTRKALLKLTLAEGVVLWLTVVIGAGFIDAAWAGEPTERVMLLVRALAFAAAAVVGFYAADLYDIVTLRRDAAFSDRLPCALAVTLLLLGACYALVPEIRLSVRTAAACAAVGLVFVFAVRAGLGHAIRRGQPERVLVLGEPALTKKVVESITSKTRGERVGEQVIVGVVDLVGADTGGEDRFDALVGATRPDRIVVATRDGEVLLPLRRLLEGRLNGITVQDWVPFYERLTGKIALEALRPASVAFGEGFGEARVHAAFARGIGLVGALVALIVLAPPLVIVGLAIRLTSPGPIFFVQQRVGRFGRPYGLIKLRTMELTDDAPSEWAADNQHRVTRIGKWLRRFRIDEVPQFINVLKGDMNLVGPRPHPVSNYLAFMDSIPHYALRSVVRPGITGWAQVRYGYANSLEQEIEKMRFDLFYIRNVSIRLDLRVLLATVQVVLRGSERTATGAQPESSGVVK